MSAIIIDVDNLIQDQYIARNRTQFGIMSQYDVVTIISDDIPFMSKDEYLDRSSVYDWKDSFQLKKELDREIFKQELRCAIILTSHLSNSSHYNKGFYKYSHGFTIILGDKECPICYQNHQLKLTLPNE
jgi:hypothetical protein